MLFLFYSYPEVHTELQIKESKAYAMRICSLKSHFFISQRLLINFWAKMPFYSIQGGDCKCSTALILQSFQCFFELPLKALITSSKADCFFVLSSPDHFETCIYREKALLIIPIWSSCRLNVLQT